jgi:hypothetical protein
MSARDIIAKLISGSPFPSKRTYDRVDDALDALDDAGYRILARGEIDEETLEAAARVADKSAATAGIISHEFSSARLEELPDAIRALKASPDEADGEARNE